MNSRSSNRNVKPVPFSEDQTQGDTQLALQAEMEEFLIGRRALNCTPATLAWYERCLDKLGYYLRKQNLDSTRQLTVPLVRRFLVYLSDDGHSPGGVATLFTGVRAYINWYGQEYQVENWRPLAGIKSPRRP